MQGALYLFHSAVNQDFALLPYSPLNISDIASPSSYYDVYSADPVAFVFADPLDNMVPLNAYWSATRRDIQTTTSTLDDLNTHGGDYALIMDLGYVIEFADYSDERLVPLTLVWSDEEQDAITSPFNAADVAALFNDNSVFRDSGTVLGWGVQGNCEHCNLGTSETFPSAGGADCPFACSGGSCATAIYHVGKDNGMSSSDGGENFLASMKLAGDVVSTFDSTVSPESGTQVHVSFEYWCCYSDGDVAIIKGVLDTWAWEPQNVTFDRAQVRIDSANDDGSVSHYSICVFLDAASNDRMMDFVGRIEEAIEDAGIEVLIPRKQQEPYHSTLAVVDGRDFPVEEALRKINEIVPPGSWTGSVPLVLTKPDW